MKTHWTDVPLFWLDGSGPLTAEQRLSALDEYRRTDGIYLVVMADPDTCAPEDRSPGEENALCQVAAVAGRDSAAYRAARHVYELARDDADDAADDARRARRPGGAL